MGDTNGIGIENHPAKKSEIGRRAAFMMTNLTYGNIAINVLPASALYCIVHIIL